MRVLLTGGGGYIGSVLSEMLVERGYDLTVLDRFFFGEETLSSIKDKIKIVKDDVRWFDPSILNGVDAVIDMAALSNDPSGELDPKKTLEINYKGRVRVAKAAKKHGVGRYLIASSCSVYGFSDSIMDERSKTNPLTTYAKANVLWENAAFRLADESFSVTSLRQATVYGLSKRMRFDLAINGIALGFFKTGKALIMRDGKQWRPFVHVKDTSSAFIKAFEADKGIVNKEIFNVGSNKQNFQIFDLTKQIAEGIGVPFEYEWYGSTDNRSYRVSFDKVANILGFNAKYTPVEGAREIASALRSGSLKDDDRTITVKWYKKLIEMQQAVRSVEIRKKIL